VATTIDSEYRFVDPGKNGDKFLLKKWRQIFVEKKLRLFRFVLHGKLRAVYMCTLETG
jgi:hypothetical protein